MMMKKLLTLLLVLGLATAANAALQISVNGNPDPEDSTINLVPSDTVKLDVWSTIDITPGGEGENACWALVAQTSCAHISGGAWVAGSNADWFPDGPYDDAVGCGVMGLAPGENGVVGYIATLGAAIPAGVLFDEIILHCETDNGPTDVILYECDGYGYVVGVWDTVVIHQIPEPATMLLLSLGGLFLRRRR
jgi:hypothetical protein